MGKLQILDQIFSLIYIKKTLVLVLAKLVSMCSHDINFLYFFIIRNTHIESQRSILETV